MHPAISIIVPCYNQEAYIGECIDSVLKQTFDDYEIIVINDGSKDNSGAIVESYVSKYGDKIRLINQENGGVIAARNTGLKEARGRYIFPLDGDDMLATDCLGALYEAMEKGLGDVIYGDTICFGSKTGKLKMKTPSRFSMILDNCNVSCSALYGKAEALKYGGYDPNMKKGMEDWEFWLNFVEDKKKFYYLPTDVLLYRILPGSRNQSFNSKEYEQLYNYMKRKHKQLFAILPLVKFWKFLFYKKITQKGKMIVKICKIPVFIGKESH